MFELKTKKQSATVSDSLDFKFNFDSIWYLDKTKINLSTVAQMAERVDVPH